MCRSHALALVIATFVALGCGSGTELQDGTARPPAADPSAGPNPPPSEPGTAPAPPSPAAAPPSPAAAPAQEPTPTATPTPAPTPAEPTPTQPQDARIAFASDRSGTWRIYIARGDGSGVTPLTTGEAPAWGWGDYCVCSPSRSPSGRTIAFVRANYEEGWGIYTMNGDGSGDPSPLEGNGWTQDAPAWSPDGSRIAFATAGNDGDQVASRRR